MGVGWPAIPSDRACQLLAMQFQLEQSQWLRTEPLRRLQLRQLGLLLAHAGTHVPFYRTRFDQLGIRPDEIESLDDWVRFPLLTRFDIQTAGDSLHSEVGPKEHGSRSIRVTSGSTGQPVSTIGTAVTRLFWNALNLREHLWHRREFTSKLAAIRYLPDRGEQDATPLTTTDWSTGTVDVVRTGPAVGIGIHHSIERQAEWLASVDPDYLLTYPSNVAALAAHFISRGWRLDKLREVRTFGEALDTHVRVACREAWNVPVVDVYSSEEVGYVALQCPKYEHYHIQSESVLVEVIKDNGELCDAGEVGRVVITTLHNFAMPLLRYEIGDYAEVGAPCDCGRGLPVLTRILGRERNIFRLPTGEQVWPSWDLGGLPDVGAVRAIRQFQVVQHEIEDVELRLVVSRKLSESEEAVLRNLLQRSLRYPFEVRITYSDRIPAGPTGKFEDFCSHVV
jgi:phenylacetate-CoA ligase